MTWGRLGTMTDLPTPLPSPEPRPIVTADDLRAALAGVPDGWYRSADLLPRYLAWAEREGKPELNAKGLGEAIARELKPEKRAKHHSAIWRIDERNLNGEVWDSPLKGIDPTTLPRYPGT